MGKSSGVKFLLQKQAQKRGGSFKGGFFFSVPSLKFISGGVEVKVFCHATKNPATTHMECPLALRRDYSIFIFPQQCGVISVIVGPDIQDIRIGDDIFDKTFIVQGNDETCVRDFLTFRIREKLLQIKDDNPVVRITKDKLTLSVPRIIDTEKILDLFIGAGLELLCEAHKLR